jgi:hypothetical protein
MPPNTITVRVSPSELFRRDGATEISVPWRTVSSVSEDDELIYIFLANGTGTPIPKRAFSSPAEAAAFYQAAESYRQTAG